MTEPEMCVCGHEQDWHIDSSMDGGCQADAAPDTPGGRTCYCPRFIPRPPRPGTMPNEGKKESLR